MKSSEVRTVGDQSTYLQSSVLIDKKKFTKSDGGTLESDWKTALPFSSHELLHSKIFLSPG